MSEGEHDFELDLSNPLGDDDIAFILPREVWEQAFGAALTQALSRSEAFQGWVDRQVVKVAEEMAKDSPHLATIREEVAEYMTRYPAISSDLRLQRKVADTIFQHMQRPV